MPLDLDFLTQIINVKWEGAEQFLYSGDDGMFGSEDGQTWEKAPSSKLALSLAYIDAVWVACGPTGTWRSEDGAQSWETVSAPIFEEVAAMQPKGKDADGKLLPGVFAGWSDDIDVPKSYVYTSQDLGKTWNKVLTIDQVVPFTDSHGDSQDGNQSVQGLSGCGGAFFICTQYLRTRYAGGDGKIYISIDGKSFSGPTMVFGPGTDLTPDDPDYFLVLSTGFSAGRVAFDDETKTYTALGFRGGHPEFGKSDYNLICTQSSTPSFGASEGTILATEKIVNEGAGIIVGNSLSGPFGGAGGNGTFATGYVIIHDVFSGLVTTDQMAHIGGTSQKLESTGGVLGSFCFKPGSEETSPGMFACVANGGVFVTTAGGTSFVKTHSGPPLTVAVGKISFLGIKPDARL